MRPGINSYRDLLVWQYAMDLAEAIYLLTRAFPREEIYGLTSQLRRSSSSVPANIAEGYGRDSRGAYVQLPKVAQGSLKEVETHLLLTTRVGLTTPTESEPLLAKADEIGRMLRSLIRSLENRNSGPGP